MEQIENKVNTLNNIEPVVELDVEHEIKKIDCFTRISMYVKNLVNCFCESSCSKNK